MFIRYCDSPRELEIKISKEELLDLSKKVLENDVEINTTMEGKNLKVAPYSRFLSKIKTSISPEQLVEFQVTQDNKVLIRGDHHKLSTLSNVFLSFAEEWTVGEHMHIEYYPGHFYLSPNSISVILVYA